DLCGDEKIWVGHRLAGPVFDTRRLVALAAEHPQHDAAMVLAPADAVGRKRIRLVAAKAIDRRSGEDGGRCGVRDKPAEVVASYRRQQLLVLCRDEEVAASLVDERLMQVPAA